MSEKQIDTEVNILKRAIERGVYNLKEIDKKHNKQTDPKEIIQGIISHYVKMGYILECHKTVDFIREFAEEKNLGFECEIKNDSYWYRDCFLVSYFVDECNKWEEVEEYINGMRNLLTTNKKLWEAQLKNK